MSYPLLDSAELTEGVRYWRVIDESLTNGKPYGWHSMSCACEDCLDADAYADAYADARTDPSRIDTRNLVTT